MLFPEIAILAYLTMVLLQQPPWPIAIFVICSALIHAYRLYCIMHGDELLPPNKYMLPIALVFMVLCLTYRMNTKHHILVWIMAWFVLLTKLLDIQKREPQEKLREETLSLLLAVFLATHTLQR